MNLVKSERGFSIIENLIAITLLSVAAASTAPLIATSFHATASARTQASILANVEQIFSTYRSQSINTTLTQINSNLSSINDGDSTTVSESTNTSKASFTTTLTALKTQTIGAPEAVRIRVDVSHDRGVFGTSNYSFETLITSLS